MLHRILSSYVAGLALTLFIGLPAMGDEQADAASNTHHGKLVRATASQLWMTSLDGKEHSHPLTAAVKFTCDGKACKVEELQPGMNVEVTTQKGNRDIVVKVDALRSDNDNLREVPNSPKREESFRRAPEQAEKEASAQATVLVNLPAGARLWFDGHATISTGTSRLFITPPVARGQDFEYLIKAEITRDGKTEKATRQITVRAGEETRVELAFADDARPDARPVAAPEDNGNGNGNGNDNTHEGMIIRVEGDQLTMGDRDGKHSHAHTIARDATIMLDGAPARLDELRPGMSLVVTTKDGDKKVVIRIEARAGASDLVP